MAVAPEIQPTITADLIDPSAGRVTIEGLGSVVVMRYVEDDGTTEGIRILVDPAPGVPYDVGPA